jgi:ubiquinone/menaquinone biosynthesis C-methylase UbiE
VDSKNRVKWVYSSRDNSELEERYNQWAKDYDGDIKKDFGYKGPQVAVSFFTKYVDKEAQILDAGAGTGLVGELLSKKSYKNLVAMDMSQGMLDEAKNKNVYKELHRMVMGEKLGFKSHSFGAVICVGTLTLGHAPAISLEELVRVTKPGGCIVFTLRPDIYEEKGFKEVQSKLEAERKWKLVEMSEAFQTLPNGGPDVYHQVWVYRVE